MAEGVRKGVVITGMSGSGKTTVLRMLEDSGFYAIDNLPPALLGQLLEVLGGHRSAVTNGLAVVMDVRSEHLLNDMEAVVGALRKTLDSLTIVYLDSDDDALVRRFETTRRDHLLAMDGTIMDGIKRERKLLSRMKSLADVVIDTSKLVHGSLRDALQEQLGLTPASFIVRVTSFGYKYGLPQDADMVLDVRFLPNPFYDENLRSLSGMDRQVQDYLYPRPESREYLAIVTHLMGFVIPIYRKSGKMRLHLAVGCTGGRHRSVAMAEMIYNIIADMGHEIIMRHRDVEKDPIRT